MICLRARVNGAGNDSAPHEVSAIGEDEAAQAWNAIVIIEDERRPRLQRHFADFVRSQFGTFGGS